MNIEWGRVRRIILNDKTFGYKPDRDCLRRLGYYLPNCQVIGFGSYGWIKMWYLLVYDPGFPDIDDGPTSNIFFKTITGKPHVYLLPSPA